MKKYHLLITVFVLGVFSPPAYGAGPVKIQLGTQTQGTLPITNGGTGTTSATGSGAVVLATSPTITAPTISGTLSAAAATTSAASINLPQGTAPTAPNDGDLWTTPSGVFARINGSTVGPLSSGTGSVTSVSGAGSVSGLSLTGSVTTSGSLTLGGTLAVVPSNFASQTANTILAAPSGSAGVPTFRALTALDMSAITSAANTWSAAQIFNAPATWNLSSVQGLHAITNYTGSFTGYSAHEIDIATDNAALGANFGTGLYVQQLYGGTAATGGRSAIWADNINNAATNSANPNRNYVGVTGQGWAAFSDGGTGLTAGTAKGAFFGLSGTGIAASGATNILNVTGAELNSSVRTGASVAIKTILQLSGQSNDAVGGTLEDSMLSFWDQNGAGGHAVGINIGNAAGISQWPIKSTGTLFSTSGSGTANLGIDLSNTTITTAAFKSTGYVVSGTGGITGAQLSVSTANPQITFIDGANAGYQTFFQGTSSCTRLYDQTGGAELVNFCFTGTTFAKPITASAGVSGALNGTVGATTPNTGAFTTITASSTATATGLLTANGGVKVAAGTAALAPVTLTAGTNLTTATAGSLEFDGTAFYHNAAASTRQVVSAEQWGVLSAAYTLTSQTAAQKLLNDSATGAFTLPVGTYEFECNFSLTSMSSTSGTFGFALGGTATFTQGWTSIAALGTGSAPTSAVTTYNTAANTALTTSGTIASGRSLIKGMLRVTVAGTVIPQVSLTVAAAAVVGANTYCRIGAIGSATVTSIGNRS